MGMVAYEAAPAFDPAFEVFAPQGDFPLAAFAFFDVPPAPFPTSAEGTFTCALWRDDISRAAFLEKIDSIRAAIARGEYYQTNLTTRLRAEFGGDPEGFFHALCAAQPDSYAFFLDFGPWQIASVSPEMFFAWNPETGELTTRPMKGTASLGRSAEDLQASPKDRAENLMIVDLLRNDIARVATDVRVPELFTIQNLPTLRQMTSTVTGRTNKGTSLADIFAALFPCGSITGAPKIAAMQAIAALETSPRGAYCGALGVVQPGGEARFSVGIRTVTMAGDKAVCGLGSGITWDSDPVAEIEENRMKRRFLFRASAAFDLVETLRLENGAYWLLTRHVERLRTSAAYFGFAHDERAVSEILRTLACENPVGLYRVRLLASREGRLKTEIYPLEAGASEINVALAATPVASDDEFLRHKTTNRAVYESFAPKDAAIFDTLLFNERGEITEFTRGNVAVEIDGQLVTPPESCGLLAGTLRGELLATGKLRERIVTCGELHRATALWFLNGVRGMIPARLVSLAGNL